MARLAEICARLRPCKSFADVGCDHGYCTQYMLKNGLCERAIIADISAGSLSKAERLLAEDIAAGRCVSVCCDGLQGIPPTVEQVLIAGMGGEEILKILRQGFIPQTFVFQPMKNAPQLRQYLIGQGCAVEEDNLFCEGGKTYFIIRGRRTGGTPAYTPAQLEFGRESLRNPAIVPFLQEEIAKQKSYLSANVAEEGRAAITRKLQFLQEVLNHDCN